ncbi:hypothetical protein FRC03_007209, partial [Tulasnella sp. 419]
RWNQRSTSQAQLSGPALPLAQTHGDSGVHTTHLPESAPAVSPTPVRTQFVRPANPAFIFSVSDGIETAMDFDSSSIRAF